MKYYANLLINDSLWYKAHCQERPPMTIRIAVHLPLKFSSEPELLTPEAPNTPVFEFEYYDIYKRTSRQITYSYRLRSISH